MFVPYKEGERSYISVLSIIDFASFYDFDINHRIVPTVGYFCFSFYYTLCMHFVLYMFTFIGYTLI